MEARHQSSTYDRWPDEQPVIIDQWGRIRGGELHLHGQGYEYDLKSKRMPPALYEEPLVVDEFGHVRGGQVHPHVEEAPERPRRRSSGNIGLDSNFLFSI